MSQLATQVRVGFYADSIVLMQLQSDLQRLDGVLDAGVVMGTEVNRELLRTSGLLDDESATAGPNDLVIAVRCQSEDHASLALGQVDDLLKARRSTSSLGWRPHSLAAALEGNSQQTWVSISIPGRYAAGLAREALDLGSPVFLYSDNVPVSDELELKTQAASLGSLVMGPDCGTAMIGGVGFGFVNQVRQGPVGLVCASGTGLQSISTRIHHLGSGVSHAIGTGGRDLSDEIGGLTAKQGLQRLARDPDTEVIVLASKPPGPTVSSEVLSAALHTQKPVVVYFSGYPAPAPRVANLHFTRSSTEAAEVAVSLLKNTEPETALEGSRGASSGRYLRGLFSGGTLALEVLQGIGPFLSPIFSNLDYSGTVLLSDPTRSRGHTLLDLGADEFTVGRLHPMMDPQLRLDRLRQEASDPETGLVVFDVILGRAAHPDPAQALGPIIEEIMSAGGPPCTAIVIGTDEDPQGLETTIERLRDLGATVFQNPTEAVHQIVRSFRQASDPESAADSREILERPQRVVNVGLEIFYQEMLAQEVSAVQVDWRPPAGGNERLISILERMRS
jgi:FdrA protein